MALASEDRELCVEAESFYCWVLQIIEMATNHLPKSLEYAVDLSIPYEAAASRVAAFLYELVKHEIFKAVTPQNL